MSDEPTLAYVFSKPPPYSDEELRLVIEEYRKKRALYLTEGKSAKTPKPKAKANLDDIVVDLE